MKTHKEFHKNQENRRFVWGGFCDFFFKKANSGKQPSDTRRERIFTGHVMDSKPENVKRYLRHRLVKVPSNKTINFKTAPRASKLWHLLHKNHKRSSRRLPPRQLTGLDRAWHRVRACASPSECVTAEWSLIVLNDS